MNLPRLCGNGLVTDAGGHFPIALDSEGEKVGPVRSLQEELGSHCHLPHPNFLFLPKAAALSATALGPQSSQSQIEVSSGQYIPLATKQQVQHDQRDWHTEGGGYRREQRGWGSQAWKPMTHQEAQLGAQGERCTQAHRRRGRGRAQAARGGLT